MHEVIYYLFTFILLHENSQSAEHVRDMWALINTRL